MSGAFEPDYAAARTRFRRAAAACGGRLHAHPLEGQTGLDGEALSIDVVVFGAPDATNALLSISGTHGQEAFAGSAAQVAWLEGAFVPPSPRVRYVFVHALNAWGFSHGFRGDRDNIDLSRNFIDFDAGPPPANPIYAALRPFGTPNVWSDEVQTRLDVEVRRTMREVGPAATLTGLTGGQFEFRDGTNYGGLAPAPSHLILRDLCRRELASVERLVFLEWHTGFGPYAEPFFVCPLPADSAELALTRAWFEHPTIGHSEQAFGSGAAPEWRGLVYQGLRRFLPRTRIAGSIVEFGTFGNREVGDAIMIDRWLRFGAGPDVPALREALRKRMMERLNPSDPLWRAAVERIGVDIQARAVRGLAGWSGA